MPVKEDLNGNGFGRKLMVEEEGEATERLNILRSLFLLPAKWIQYQGVADKIQLRLLLWATQFYFYAIFCNIG